MAHKIFSVIIKHKIRKSKHYIFGVNVKTVVAIDSFKESVSSLQAAESVKRGILSVYPNMEVCIFQLADGGEGTVDAITLGCGGEFVHCDVMSCSGNTVNAKYGIVRELGTAVIEAASAAGLALVPTGERNPLNATSYGVGQLILDAMDKGYRQFIIGLGGSGTNDGGIGMLQALGYRFLDSTGNDAGIFGRDVERIVAIDIGERDRRLDTCSFLLASDVNNPLCGVNGASAIFGPQKGADPATVTRLDKALACYAALTEKTLGRDMAHTPGAGAAGGLGFAFMAYLNATVKPGVDTVIEMTHIEDAIRSADFVITGEGKLDSQTVMGKAPMGIARIAKKYGKLVIAIAGGVSNGAEECNRVGIDAYFPVLQMPMPLEQALEVDRTAENIAKTARQIFNLIRASTACKSSKGKC